MIRNVEKKYYMIEKIVVNEKEKELILVRGAPGSGKSTLAMLISIKFGYDIHENDAFFTNNNGEYNFDINFHQHAKDVCFEKTCESLDLDRSVVVSNTFTTIKEMEPYLEFARKKMINVNVIEMDLQYDNVHCVPDFVVKDKIEKFERYPNAHKISSSNYELVSVETNENKEIKRKKLKM